MAVFNDYLPKLLQFEGGFVDDGNDPGGPTQRGITLKTFQALGPAMGFTDTSLDALKRLSADDAGRFYKRMFWDALDADAIALQALAEMLVDFHVNAGGSAIRQLQLQLNEQHAALRLPHPPLRADGAWGPNTARALSRIDPVAAYRELRRRRIAYYRGLVDGCPELAKYLQGWLNRVDAFPVL